MNVEYEFTKEDYVEFNYDVLLINNPGYKKSINNKKYLMFVITIFSILAFVSCLVSGTYILGVIFLALGLISNLLLWQIYSTKNILNRIRKVVDKDQTKVPNALFCKRLVTLDSEHITSVSEFWDNKYSWSGIVKVVNTGKYIYLLETQISALVIPKRAFSDDNSFDLFAKKAEEYREKTEIEKNSG
jgi:hypothetical protein